MFPIFKCIHRISFGSMELNKFNDVCIHSKNKIKSTGGVFDHSANETPYSTRKLKNHNMHVAILVVVIKNTLVSPLIFITSQWESH